MEGEETTVERAKKIQNSRKKLAAVFWKFLSFSLQTKLFPGK